METQSSPSTTAVVQQATEQSSSELDAGVSGSDQSQAACTAQAPRHSLKRPADSAPSSEDENEDRPATTTLKLYSYSDDLVTSAATVSTGRRSGQTATTRGTLAKRAASRRSRMSTFHSNPGAALWMARSLSDDDSNARPNQAGAGGSSADMRRNKLAMDPKRARYNHSTSASHSGPVANAPVATSRRVIHSSLLVHPVENYSSSKPPQYHNRRGSSAKDALTGRQRSKSLPPAVNSLAQDLSVPSRQLNARSRAQRDPHLTWRRVSALDTQIASQQSLQQRHKSNFLAHRSDTGPETYDDAAPSGDWVMSQTELKALHAVEGPPTGLWPDDNVVPTSPPITKATLRELDLHEILRNPQLRHDSVFDPNLMFRPNYDGERGDRKRELATQYWTAVMREVKYGCRCTTFSQGQILPCLCLTTWATLDPSDTLSQHLPSRLTPLVHELRAILVSLLPTASTSSPSSSSSSISISRDQVLEVLDPAFLSQQIHRGVLDVGSLAVFLGRVLKLHCAPMRDAMVDEMVKACESGVDGQGDIVTGLRLCFEILELMKLDIANHQLRSLRPYLIQTAVDFESRYVQDVVARRRNKNAGDPAKTAAWLETALKRQQSQNGPYTSATLTTAVRDSLLDLVFRPMQTSTSTAAFPEALQLDTYRLLALHADVTDLTVVYLLLSLFHQLVGPGVKLSPQDSDGMRKDIWCILAAETNSSTAPSSSLPVSAANTGLAKLKSPAFQSAVRNVGLQVAARATRHQQPESFDSNIAPTPATVNLVDAYLTTHVCAESPLFQLLQSRLKLTIGEVVKEQMIDGDVKRTHWWLALPSTQTVPANGAGSRFAMSSSPGDAARPAGPARSVVHSSATVGTGSNSAAPDSLLGSPKSEWIDASDDEPPSICRRRGSVNQGTLPVASVALSSPTTMSASVGSQTAFEIALTRNGLTALETEVRLLGERIARVTTFHLAVYKDLYAASLLDDA